MRQSRWASVITVAVRWASLEMRKEPTDAEAKLWAILRDRALGGYKFRRQHPVAGYIVDSYCVKRRLVVGLDGGQHNDSDAITYDDARTSRLAEFGIRVLRFWDDDILRSPDTVAQEILRHLGGPPPDPLPEYRERGNESETEHEKQS